MYISHLSGVKHVKDTAVRICESLISDAVASPEVSPSGCRIKLLWGCENLLSECSALANRGDCDAGSE